MGRLRALPPLIRNIRSAVVKPEGKRTDPFYLSPEYQRWRAFVIARVGGRCQWPGCGTTIGRMYADHIQERSDGGADLDVTNGQCLCHRHHVMKTYASRAARLRQD